MANRRSKEGDTVTGEHMATKQKTKRRTRERALAEGGSVLLNVHTQSRVNREVNALLPKAALRYLKVRSGDKLQLIAHDGIVEISPILSIQEEIEKYIAH